MKAKHTAGWSASTLWDGTGTPTPRPLRAFAVLRPFAFSALLLLPLVAGCGPKADDGGGTGAAPAGGKAPITGKKVTIGFSQVTTTEPWRHVFNEKLEAEAKLHPEVTLVMQDAQDKTELQVQQM